MHCEGIIPFFNHVAKSHPRNLKLISHPFCPDGAALDTFLVPLWWNGRSAPCHVGWSKFQGKTKQNNFTSPSLFSATPPTSRQFADGSFSHTTLDGIKPSSCSPSQAVNSQNKWLSFWVITGGQWRTRFRQTSFLPNKTCGPSLS